MDMKKDPVLLWYSALDQLMVLSGTNMHVWVSRVILLVYERFLFLIIIII